MLENQKEWHNRMHREVVTYPDPEKTNEENMEKHGRKLEEWLRKNPLPPDLLATRVIYSCKSCKTNIRKLLKRSSLEK